MAVDISKKDYLANLYNQEEIIEILKDNVISKLENEINTTLDHVKGQVDIMVENNTYNNEAVAKRLEELI